MKPCDLLSVDRALASFLEVVAPLTRTVSVRLEEADERVLARDVLAPMDYPHYDQCILDGYGVLASDTEGCGEGVERSLRLSGTGPVESGVCVSAHTGSPLPPGADALLRLEGTAEREGHILVREAVTRGQWVWPKGGGIRQGAVVNKEGMQLKPSDIAMLAKLGLFEVEVYDRPRVLVVPTGDECVKRGAPIGPGFVYEVNGLMCQLLVERYGGAAALHEIVPDCEARLRDALESGTSHDLIVTIGGSSAGRRDLMERVVRSMGEVLFHGVALHPGNHMGAGFIRSARGRTPVLFLPGYTESCAVAAFTFVDAAVKRLGHRHPSRHPRQEVRLAQKVTAPGPIRAVRKVVLLEGKARPIRLIGESVFSGPYGYVVLPEGRGSFEADEVVEAIDLE